MNNFFRCLQNISLLEYSPQRRRGRNVKIKYEKSQRSLRLCGFINISFLFGMISKLESN